MQEIIIGLGDIHLDTDQLIQAYDVAKDPEYTAFIEDQELPALLGGTFATYDTLRNYGALAYREFIDYGEVKDPERDNIEMLSGYEDGYVLVVALFSLFKTLQDPGYSVATRPKYQTPIVEHLAKPGLKIFVPESNQFSDTLKALTRDLAKDKEPHLDGYEPYSPYASGLEYGSQVMLQILGLRHQDLVARFERGENLMLVP